MAQTRQAKNQERILPLLPLAPLETWVGQRSLPLLGRFLNLPRHTIDPPKELLS